MYKSIPLYVVVLVSIVFGCAAAEDDLAPSTLTGTEVLAILEPWMTTAALKNCLVTTPALVGKHTFHWVLADGSLWTGFKPLAGGRAAIISWKIESAACNITGGPLVSVSQLMSHYYLNPQPGLIAQLLADASTLGLFENKGSASALVSFLSQVFSQNPKRLSEWLDGIQSLPQRHRHLVYQSLWKSNTDESRRMLQQYSPSHGADKGKLKELAVQEPADPITASIESPSNLDELWAAFSVTGDPRFVERIISVFSWENESSEADHGRKIIVGAAKWSLASQLKQHEVLRQIYLDSMSDADDRTKVILQTILSGSNSETQ